MGPRQPRTANYEYETEVPRRVPGCTPHCGPNETAPGLWGAHLTTDALPSGKCNELYPAYSFPRGVAGSPLAADGIKCQLKAVSASDYKVTFTADETARLLIQLATPSRTGQAFSRR